MQKTNILSKIGQFLKRNVYYVLLIACIAAVGTMVTLTVIEESSDVQVQAPGGDSTQNNGGDQTVINPSPDVIPKPDDGKVDAGDDKDDEVVTIIFTAPVASATSTKGYSMDTLVFSQTNNQWECHDGIDYFASAGSSVVAVYGGTVESVTNDPLNGNVVVINHGNGLKSTYANLGEVTCTAGKSVVKGASIGTVGNSGLMEIADGDHLHFEVTLNGESVDPTTYYSESDK